MACQNALKGIPQFLEVVVDGRDDDGDIFRCKRRLGRDRYGFVDPMADYVDDEAKVSIQPACDKLVFLTFW